MRGDVWVSVNNNGEKILNIDNGKFIKQSVIKPKIKYKIKQPK
jgi:dUTPase